MAPGPCRRRQALTTYNFVKEASCCSNSRSSSTSRSSGSRKAVAKAAAQQIVGARSYVAASS